MAVKTECVCVCIIHQFHTKHLSNHSHFCPMQCQFFFSFQRPRLISCNVQLRTHAFPHNTNETSLAVRKEASDLNWKKPPRIMAVSAASATPSTDNRSPTQQNYFYTRTINNIHTRLYFIISLSVLTAIFQVNLG